MGLYARRLGNSKGGAKKLAKKAADHGLKHLELMGPWQEPAAKGSLRIATRTPNGIEKILRYSEALASKGVAPLVWFYPWAGEEGRILEYLERLLDRGAPIAGLLPDPELGSKWKGRKRPKKIHSMRGAQGEAIRGATGTSRRAAKAAAVKLMRGLAALVTEYASLQKHGVGVTSYGILRYHKTLPVEELLKTTRVWLSPQLYTAKPDLVDEMILDWRERADDLQAEVVPSFATFGPNSGLKLLSHLISFVDGNEDVHGLMGWSVPQTSAREWNVIALFADWLERGVCALGGASPAARRALSRIAA
jgi:hypothetical protein